VLGLRRVLLMLRHCAHSRNRPTDTDEKTRKVFSILVAISLVDTISGKKIMKTVATRCHILKPKCTKFDFGWSFAADPVAGAYSAPRDSLAAGFKGDYF